MIIHFYCNLMPWSKAIDPAYYLFLQFYFPYSNPAIVSRETMHFAVGVKHVNISGNTLCQAETMVEDRVGGRSANE
jgi:hypothetical protein